ncbi:MAG: MBL fold metallo-hydrolase [Desulfosalsimonadaceae bacterium]
MPPSFQPCLINDASGDPGLFISFAFNRRAIVFDLGDIAALSPRDTLKISHVFISHTHMDHFAGFDRLLRTLLGRSKTLYIYGPEGFLRNLEGKLSGYTWNLVENFTNQLIIHATEVTEEHHIARRYACRDGFQPIQDPTPPAPRFHHTENNSSRNVHVLHQEPSFHVTASVLDHGIPCLGFSLKENFRINIRKDRLDDLGLLPGPWLYQFKQAVYDGRDPESIFPVLNDQDGPAAGKGYTIKGLLEEIAIVSKGQKITYIVDAAYQPANVEKMIALAKNADHLFIEAAFLEKDRGHAARKLHLTARQAGEIAGLAGARRFTLFHFSSRYQHAEKLFYAEAMEGYFEYFKGIPESLDA